MVVAADSEAKAARLIPDAAAVVADAVVAAGAGAAVQMP